MTRQCLVLPAIVERSENVGLTIIYHVSAAFEEKTVGKAAKKYMMLCLFASFPFMPWLVHYLAIPMTRLMMGGARKVWRHHAQSR